MARLSPQRTVQLLRASVFAIAAGHLVWLAVQIWLAVTQGASALGANPIEAAIRFLGLHSLRLLLLTLAVTPLVALTGWRPLMAVRRQLGLWAFAYGVLHLLMFLGADLEFSLAALWTEVVKRQYITVGMAALLLLVPLAATSTRRAMRALGARAWQRLHRLVYPAGLLACLHFIFMVKGVQPEPLVYTALACLLLVMRIRPARRADL